MTPKLPVVTADELARVARKIGFRLHRRKGSHAIYYRECDKARIVIPMHAGKSIAPGTLACILDDMGISADRLRELL